MTPMRVLIADDEPPARRKLRRLLEAEPDVEIAGEAGTLEETRRAIEKLRPDVVFLDIQMPDGSGFDVAAGLNDAGPRVVFVTAFDQFALKAFEVQAIDYLLKPVDSKRFAAAMARLRKRLEEAKRTDLAEAIEAAMRKKAKPARLLLDVGGKSIFVAVETIEHVEAARNYLTVHAGGEVHTVRGTLDGIAEQLDETRFARINRSQIVNLDCVREMQPWFHGEYRVILKSGLTLRWSRRFAPGKASLARIPAR